MPDVPVIGPAAAADNAQSRKQAGKILIQQTEFFRIAFIKCLALVELFMVEP